MTLTKNNPTILTQKHITYITLILLPNILFYFKGQKFVYKQTVFIHLKTNLLSFYIARYGLFLIVGVCWKSTIV